MIDDIEESYQIEGIIDDLLGLESEISQSSLSDSEKKILLYAGSVARHSLDFWYQNVDTSEVSPLARLDYKHDNSSIYFATQVHTGDSFNPENLMYENANRYLYSYTAFDEIFKKGWLRKLLNVVVGDIVGALVGAGVMSLTPCSPLCIAGGALIGAVGASMNVADGQGLLNQ